MLGVFPFLLCVIKVFEHVNGLQRLKPQSFPPEGVLFYLIALLFAHTAHRESGGRRGDGSGDFIYKPTNTGVESCDIPCGRTGPPYRSKDSLRVRRENVPLYCVQLFFNYLVYLSLL